ncbi:CAP domain-containing protein [Paenibacillus glacialis]|uniref:Transporter n=1 Tax=Paenibacillus glacialis TaxID=494026 RepID=A0A168KFH7_9BACL|nr:CAP domain-containing protein [Paenibacillus glacialis]OAB41934.1 transporter [Paenibacillus glacialis]
MRKRISSRRRVKRNPSKITKRVRKTRIRTRQANAYELQVFRLVNEERTSRGIAALTLNSTLTDLASLKSRDMRDNNYFGHTSPTYGTPGEMLNRFGVTWRAYGENIAAGQTTPEEVMRVWMNSPGHRANILDPRFTDIGVGYVTGTATSRYQTYWTQLFIQKP